MERLVGYGAGVNTQDVDGNTPLHMILSKDAMEVPSDDTPELKKVYNSTVALNIATSFA